jgi:hypothetical protein
VKSYVYIRAYEEAGDKRLTFSHCYVVGGNPGEAYTEGRRKFSPSRTPGFLNDYVVQIHREAHLPAMSGESPGVGVGKVMAEWLLKRLEDLGHELSNQYNRNHQAEVLRDQQDDHLKFFSGQINLLAMAIAECVPDEAGNEGTCETAARLIRRMYRPK